MADDLVLYTNPMSRGRMARWMLEEVGQPYRTELVDYASIKAPSYLAINPMGKVPALRHGNTVITETAAICAYLADAFPQAGLAPPLTDRLRGTYLRWMFFAAGPLEAAVTNKALGFEVPPGRERMAGYGSMTAVLDALEAFIPAAFYLLGPAFSALDVYLGSQISFGLMFNSIERRPSFEPYVARIMQRPAALRADAIDGSMAPPRPAETH